MPGVLDDDAVGQKHSIRGRRRRDAHRYKRRGASSGPLNNPRRSSLRRPRYSELDDRPFAAAWARSEAPCACQARRWSSQNCWRALLARGTCESGYVPAIACPSHGRRDIDRGTDGRAVEGRTSQGAYASISTRRPSFNSASTPRSRGATLRATHAIAPLSIGMPTAETIAPATSSALRDPRGREPSPCLVKRLL